MAQKQNIPGYLAYRKNKVINQRLQAEMDTYKLQTLSKKSQINERIRETKQWLLGVSKHSGYALNGDPSSATMTKKKGPTEPKKDDDGRALVKSATTTDLQHSGASPGYVSRLRLQRSKSDAGVYPVIVPVYKVRAGQNVPKAKPTTSLERSKTHVTLRLPPQIQMRRNTLPFNLRGREGGDDDEPAVQRRRRHEIRMRMTLHPCNHQKETPAACSAVKRRVKGTGEELEVKTTGKHTRRGTDNSDKTSKRLQPATSTSTSTSTRKAITLEFPGEMSKTGPFTGVDNASTRRNKCEGPISGQDRSMNKLMETKNDNEGISQGMSSHKSDSINGTSRIRVLPEFPGKATKIKIVMRAPLESTAPPRKILASLDSAADGAASGDGETTSKPSRITGITEEETTREDELTESSGVTMPTTCQKSGAGVQSQLPMLRPGSSTGPTAVVPKLSSGSKEQLPVDQKETVLTEESTGGAGFGKQYSIFFNAWCNLSKSRDQNVRMLGRPVVRPRFMLQKQLKRVINASIIGQRLLKASRSSKVKEAAKEREEEEQRLAEFRKSLTVLKYIRAVNAGKVPDNTTRNADRNVAVAFNRRKQSVGRVATERPSCIDTEQDEELEKRIELFLSRQ